MMANKSFVNLVGAELIVEARKIVVKHEKEELVSYAYTTVNIDEILELQKQLEKVLFCMSGREVYYRVRSLINYYYKLKEAAVTLSAAH